MIRWILLLLPPALAWAQPATLPTKPDAQAAHAQLLKTQLEEAKNALAVRSTAIEKEMKEIMAALAEIEPQAGQSLSLEQTKQRDLLTGRRSSLQNELTFLQQMVRARQSALDSQEYEIQTLRELELFNAEASQKKIYSGPAEIAALKAQLDLSRSLLDTIEHSNVARRQRLKNLQEKIDQEESPQKRQILLAERDAITAQLDSARESQENQKAQIELFETQLKIVSPATAATSLPATATGPADEKEAESKQKLAEVLEREARGEFEEAKRQLREIAQKMEKVREKGGDYEKLRDDREYWLHKRYYEDRRLRQADGEKRVAVEKREAARIQTEIDAAGAELIALGKDKSLTQEERNQKAKEYKTLADRARESAKAVEARVEAERPNADLWQRLHANLDTTEAAVRERLLRQWNATHYPRMKRIIETERQQINNLMNLSEVVSLTLTRQATLLRRLADVYVQCAETLVPPEPSFWERHVHIIQSIRIVLIALMIAYAVRLFIWFGQSVARYIGRDIAPGRFSVKRVETLFSFFGSITQLFIWLFALVMVLNEFGFDPAKSTGAIGLIGLILAGMFQQLVIDFVKGLDIITGRHYNVGDFVELDGKSGHVIDFSVKHTRIRTASGQEYNLPNSKCIPSRRFPDGYVDNYVDIFLKTPTDIARAKRAIAPVCRYLGRRIEQVKDEAIFVDRLPGTRPNTLILRYRIRVLPSCGWVITTQFIPDVKAALAEEGIELAGEPTFFFINRIQTFRQLFSRELSEEEILREVKEQDAVPVEKTPPKEPAIGESEPSSIPVKSRSG